MPFEIEVRFDDGRAPLVQSVHFDERGESFTFPVEATPSDVVLDPHTRTLFEADFGPTGD